eukprot:1371307-Amorphochlora_amoeboformis.AAC.2
MHEIRVQGQIKRGTSSPQCSIEPRLIKPNTEESRKIIEESQRAWHSALARKDGKPTAHTTDVGQGEGNLQAILKKGTRVQEVKSTVTTPFGDHRRLCLGYEGYERTPCLQRPEPWLQLSRTPENWTGKFQDMEY